MRRLHALAPIALLLVLSPLKPASAQAPNFSAQNKEAMKPLQKMAGRWEGEATIQLGPGQPAKIRQTENVVSKLDGQVLFVEGIGYSKEPGQTDKVEFNAVAVFAYDPRAKGHKVHAFRDAGTSVVADATVDGDTIIWGFEDGRGGKIRYTITLADTTWHEIGEYIPQAHQPTKFFEMSLKRILPP
jgi:hypothetical protein